MNVCIRCNPISELLTAEDGSQSCRYCGGNYLMESRPDPEPEAVPEVVLEELPDADAEVRE